MPPWFDGVGTEREQHRLKLQLEVTPEQPWMHFHSELLKPAGRKKKGVTSAGIAGADTQRLLLPWLPWKIPHPTPLLSVANELNEPNETIAPTHPTWPPEYQPLAGVEIIAMIIPHHVVFGNPMGPGGNTSGNPMMPSVASSGSGMNSPPFMGQQPFQEGSTGKGYVQPGMYGRTTYPGGPGFTTRI
ncbi:UNVERIFIED_CONTAM: hypothetical protein K2H54_027472 [Gekko kuhli]